MSRTELIEQLEKIDTNIKVVKYQINIKVEDSAYYLFFNEVDPNFNHIKEIRTKAFAFWVRKFNRTLEQLKY